jgi:hypothetical protein
MMNENSDSELITALSRIRDICANSKDKGSGFILLAAQKDEASLTALSDALSKNFGADNKLSNELIISLTSVHNLSHSNTEYQNYSCEFAHNLIIAKAQGDYVNVGSKDKSICGVS